MLIALQIVTVFTMQKKIFNNVFINNNSWWYVQAKITYTNCLEPLKCNNFLTVVEELCDCKTGTLKQCDTLEGDDFHFNQCSGASYSSVNLRILHLPIIAHIFLILTTIWKFSPYVQSVPSMIIMLLLRSSPTWMVFDLNLMDLQILGSVKLWHTFNYNIFAGLNKSFPFINLAKIRKVWVLKEF